MGISGVYTEEASWVNKERSVQIDLLIDRRDHVINLCEVKFTQEPFTLTKTYKKEFEKKKYSALKRKYKPEKRFPRTHNHMGVKRKYTLYWVYTKHYNDE